jgi:serine/threonine-protein kinase
MSARDDRVGSVVDGRYRILERMAEGSMGVVYRGERVPVGKPVAIKFLHAAFASYPEFAERFDRETRVMSKLAHPHCASVLDFGETDGARYIVMEFVAGRTLRALLDDGPLDSMTALKLARQLAAGLAHAHAQGIVHRDIKPANLMITEEVGVGLHLWILDFGLARLRGAIGANATATHIAIGTPSYMSPEQTVGGATDARSDIYAAGVVLFEMITGERPFQADDTADLLAMHRGAPVPPLTSKSALPAGLQALVERAMAKDPAARFQTAIELQSAIDRVIAGRPETVEIGSSQIEIAVPAPAPARAPTRVRAQPRRSHARTFVLLAVLVAFAAVALYVQSGHDESKPAAPASGSAPGAAAKKPAAKPAPPPTPAPPAPPPAPKQADNVRDAIQLIKDGHKELALISLKALRKSDPKDAEVPFVLGNLNFDDGAGATALDDYQAAIALDKAYRGNAILDGNVVQLLGNPRLRARAALLIKKTLGKAAIPALRDGTHDKDPVVRKQAAALLRALR